MQVLQWRSKADVLSKCILHEYRIAQSMCGPFHSESIQTNCGLGSGIESFPIQLLFRVAELKELSWLKIAAELQASIGEEIDLEFDESDWRYSGIISAVQIVPERGGIIIGVLDPLELANNVVQFQTFTAMDAGAIAEKLFPAAKLILLSSASQSLVDLAIQFNESQTEFFSRVARRTGVNFWYDGSAIVVGTGNSGETTATLDRDIIDWSLTFALGQEKIRVQTFDSMRATASSETVELPDTNTGLLHKEIVGRRKSKTDPHGENTQYFVRKGDEIQNTSTLGLRDLRKSSASRLVLEGTILYPVRIGSAIEVSDAQGRDPMRLLVSDFKVVARKMDRPIFSFRAVSIDAFFSRSSSRDTVMKWSIASVKEIGQGNAPKVQFPWDTRHGITPYLRMVSPSIGPQQLHSMPLCQGDWVLVAWEDEAIDPLVIGALPVGKTIESRDNRLSFSFADGSEIVCDSNGVFRLLCKGKSALTIEPGKISLSASQIDVKTKKLNIT